MDKSDVQVVIAIVGLWIVVALGVLGLPQAFPYPINGYVLIGATILTVVIVAVYLLKFRETRTERRGSRSIGIADYGKGTRITRNVIEADVGILHGETASGGTDEDNIIKEKRKKSG
jgi:hypothetical protein